MLELATVTRLRWFPGIASAKNDKGVGLREWLQSGGNIPIPTAAPDVAFSYSFPDELASALAVDANSFALKSVESVDAISETNGFPKATAWSAIQIYYTAFFCAAFLARICGRGVTYLEAADARAIRKFSDQVGVPVQLTAGLYSIRSDAPARTLTLSKHSSGLGSHEATWMEFRDLVLELERSTQDLLVSDAARARTRNLLKLIRSGIERDSCSNGNWLSTVRNEINYRRNETAWFPFRRGNKLQELLRALHKCDTTLDEAKLQSKNDQEAFFTLCSFIFGWALTVIADLSLRSSGNKSVFRLGVQNYVAKTSLKNVRV